MPTLKPKSLTIRTYDIGFDNCFLLTFHYKGKTRNRYVLIDFGSTAQPKEAKKSRRLGKRNIFLDCDIKL